jgi:uncharacterized protein (TIGR03546 family)
MIKAVARLIVALNSNAKKSQIAAGFAWGLLLGLVPAGNFFWIVLFVVSFFFDHNHGSKIFAMALVKLCAPFLAPLVDSFGWQVLHIEALQPLFTTMFNMPFVPFTKFNNTLVAGGLVGGAILWLPAFIIFMLLIPLYRNTLAPKIRNSKLIQAIGKSPLMVLIGKAIAPSDE